MEYCLLTLSVRLCVHVRVYNWCGRSQTVLMSRVCLYMRVLAFSCAVSTGELVSSALWLYGPFVCSSQVPILLSFFLQQVYFGTLV